jgi:hypothetical protein
MTHRLISHLLNRLPITVKAAGAAPQMPKICVNPKSFSAGQSILPHLQIDEDGVVLIIAQESFERIEQRYTVTELINRIHWGPEMIIDFKASSVY